MDPGCTPSIHLKGGGILWEFSGGGFGVFGGLEEGADLKSLKVIFYEKMLIKE
jgi:hypothetical protein